MSVYISLGTDCSISYQLRKMKLQTYGSMPFDWMKIRNVDKLISILDNDFQGFADFSKYDIKIQNNTFYFINDDIKYIEKLDNIKSLVKLTHREYNFTLPHEYNENIINILEFEKKYSRRIERFRQIVKNPDIQKIFVRLSNTKEQNKLQKNINNNYLENILFKYGCNNFQLRFINMDQYVNLIPVDEEFNWHRDYIDWTCIL